jgi:hypothetical protein
VVEKTYLWGAQTYMMKQKPQELRKDLLLAWQMVLHQ